MASKMKRQRLVFSEKLMYAFIRDYKNNGCLWDIKNPDYKCTEKRKAAVSKLAAKYEITEEETKKKLNSLRSTYLQEKKKVEESKKSGGEIYEPSLYWFHELEFLFDVIIPRKAPLQSPPTHCPPASPQPPTLEQCQVIQGDQNVEVISEEEVDQDHLIFEFVPDDDDKVIVNQKLGPASYAVHPPKSSGIVRKLNTKRRLVKKSPPVSHQQYYADPVDLQSRVLSHERTCHSPQPSSQPSLLAQQEDEFATFCCSIASQLRTLPRADAIEMQLEIQQLVSKRRLAVLKSQQNVTILRTWQNANGDHQYHTRPSAIDNDSGQEEDSETFILGH